MRTTLTIDDDVLTAAKVLAEQTSRSTGEIVPDFARSVLRPPAAASERTDVLLLPVRNRGAVVTLETVNALRDETP